MDARDGKGRGRRGILVDNAYLREEIRTLRARLEVLEAHKPRGHTGDTSDEDEPGEEEATAETPEVKILKSIFGAGSS